MNTIGKILGLGLLSVIAVGCAPPLKEAEPKLGKYDTNFDKNLSGEEARLLLENEFDIDPKDGVLSDKETLKALDYAGKIPDNIGSNYSNFQYSRKELLDAILKLREQREISVEGTTS